MSAVQKQFSNQLQFVKHLKTSLFVGTLLNLINQGEAILSLRWQDIVFFNLMLTFLVPFAVSVYATIKSDQTIPQSK